MRLVILTDKFLRQKLCSFIGSTKLLDFAYQIQLLPNSNVKNIFPDTTILKKYYEMMIFYCLAAGNRER